MEMVVALLMIKSLFIRGASIFAMGTSRGFLVLTTRLGYQEEHEMF